MPRNPWKPTSREGGSVELRVTVPPMLWGIALEVSELVKIEPEKAFALLVDQINLSALKGDVKFLGGFAHHAQVVLNKRIDQFDDGTPTIEYDKLHKSDRTKSGFVGVYQNGQGFRAHADGDHGQKTIGTFPTAAEAAWRRYLYYKKHRLPYGHFEAMLEKCRKDLRYKDLPERAIYKFAAYELGQINESHESIPDEYQRWYKRDPTDERDFFEDNLRPVDPQRETIKERQTRELEEKIAATPAGQAQKAEEGRLRKIAADYDEAQAAAKSIPMAEPARTTTTLQLLKPLTRHEQRIVAANRQHQTPEYAQLAMKVAPRFAVEIEAPPSAEPKPVNGFDDSIDYAAIGAAPANAQERKSATRNATRNAQHACKLCHKSGHNIRRCPLRGSVS